MQRPLLVVFLVLAIALGGCATGRKMVRPNPHEPSDPRAAASSQTVAFTHLQPDEFDQPVTAVSVTSSEAGEVEAQRDYIGAQRDYWIARAELERSIGGTLPGTQ